MDCEGLMETAHRGVTAGSGSEETDLVSRCLDKGVSLTLLLLHEAIPRDKLCDSTNKAIPGRTTTPSPSPFTLGDGAIFR